MFRLKMVVLVVVGSSGLACADRTDGGEEGDVGEAESVGESESVGETGDGDTDEDGGVEGIVDEAGVWSLQRFALDGTNWVAVDQQARQNAFMLRFDPDRETVAAATCVGGGSSHVQSSLCRIDINYTWECRCFSYAWTGLNNMAWAEFEPGMGPGNLDSPDVESAVQEDLEINGAALWSPLPADLFNSNEVSRYQLLPRAEFLFEETGCAEACAG